MDGPRGRYTIALSGPLSSAIRTLRTTMRCKTWRNEYGVAPGRKVEASLRQVLTRVPCRALGPSAYGRPPPQQTRCQWMSHQRLVFPAVLEGSFLPSAGLPQEVDWGATPLRRRKHDALGCTCPGTYHPKKSPNYAALKHSPDPSMVHISTPRPVLCMSSVFSSQEIVKLSPPGILPTHQYPAAIHNPISCSIRSHGNSPLQPLTQNAPSP